MSRRKYYYWHGVLNKRDFAGVGHLELVGKTIEQIEHGILHAEYVFEKMHHASGNLYKTRLNEKVRLLGTTFMQDGAAYLVILAIIADHNYHKSVFVRDEHAISRYLNVHMMHLMQEVASYSVAKQIEWLEHPVEAVTESEFIYDPNVVYQRGEFIVLDTMQEQALKTTTYPILLDGAPGTGKTVVLKEMLRNYQHQQIPVLYITKSAGLAKKFYDEWDYRHRVEDNLWICSYEQLAQRLAPHLSELQVASTEHFYKFCDTYLLRTEYKEYKLQCTPEMLLQEMRLLSAFKLGEQSKELVERSRFFTHQPYLDSAGNLKINVLNKATYLGLGARQSLFADGDLREKFLWKLYDAYVDYLQAAKLWDPAFQILNYEQPIFAGVFIDEAMDLSCAQLLQLLRFSYNQTCVLALDQRQSLYDILSHREMLLYFFAQARMPYTHCILQINYRCKSKIIEFANLFITMKQTLTGGAVDKHGVDTEHLVADAAVTEPGIVQIIPRLKSIEPYFEMLNSRDCAIITHKQHKAEVKALFNNAANIFDIEEIKGLQYEVIFLVKPFADQDDTWHDTIQRKLQGWLRTNGEDAECLQHANRAKSRELSADRLMFNALVTAITRAETAVYIFDDEHGRFHTLYAYIEKHYDIPTMEIVKLPASTAEDWQERAGILLDQDLDEQAHDIFIQYVHNSETVYAEFYAKRKYKSLDVVNKPIAAKKNKKKTNMPKSDVEPLQLAEGVAVIEEPIKESIEEPLTVVVEENSTILAAGNKKKKRSAKYANTPPKFIDALSTDFSVDNLKHYMGCDPEQVQRALLTSVSLEIFVKDESDHLIKKRIPDLHNPETLIYLEYILINKARTAIFCEFLDFKAGVRQHVMEDLHLTLGIGILHYAAWYNADGLLEWAVKNEFPLNVYTKNLHSPLYFAIIKLHSVDAVRILHQNQVPVFQKDFAFQNTKGVVTCLPVYICLEKYFSSDYIKSIYAKDAKISEDIDIKSAQESSNNNIDVEPCVIELPKEITTKALIKQQASRANFYTLSMRLLLYIRTNNLFLLQQLVNENPWLVNAPHYDTSQASPLLVATQFGYKEIITYLLANNANLHYCNQDGVNAILLAAQFGYYDIVEQYLAAGVFPDQETKNLHCTALISAVYFGRIEIVQLLLSQPMYISQTLANKQAFSAHDLAERLYGKDSNVVAYFAPLLDIKDAYDRLKNEALNSISHSVFKILSYIRPDKISHFEYILSVQQHSDTFFNSIITMTNNSNEHKKILHEQIVTMKFRFNRTVLHLCALHNKIDWAEFFYSIYSPDEKLQYLNMCDVYNYTILEYALSRKYWQFAYRVLANGASPSIDITLTQNVNNFSEIHKIKLLIFLLDRATLPNNKYFDKILKLVANCKTDDVTQIDIGMPLLHAINRGHLDYVKFFIERGVNVELIASNEDQTVLRRLRGFAPLVLAARRAHKEMVEYLLSRSIKYVDQAIIGVLYHMTQTVINNALFQLYFSILCILLQIDHDNNKQFLHHTYKDYIEIFFAALGQCAHNQYLDVEKQLFITLSKLLDMDMSVGIVTPELGDLLFMAINNKCSLSVIELLLEYNCDPNLITPNGKSLLDEEYALENQDVRDCLKFATFRLNVQQFCMDDAMIEEESTESSDSYSFNLPRK